MSGWPPARVKDNDQHSFPRPLRDIGPHDHDPVKRGNGDIYCRPCGMLLLCNHGAWFDDQPLPRPRVVP